MALCAAQARIRAVIPGIFTRDESMTESTQAVQGHLYPDIESYVEQRIQEFGQIASERQQELQQLADYVSDCLGKGHDASLTFVCTHNSRRSHLTQVWAQVAAACFGIRGVRTYSGGTEVTACNPRTVDALKRCGIRFHVLRDDSSNPQYAAAFSDSEPSLVCYSKVFNLPPNPTSNYCAVMTCSHADKSCPVAIGCDLRLAVRYEDPKISDDTPSEAETYDHRCAQIAREMLFAFSRVKA